MSRQHTHRFLTVGLFLKTYLARYQSDGKKGAWSSAAATPLSPGIHVSPHQTPRILGACPYLNAQPTHYRHCGGDLRVVQIYGLNELRN